MVTRIDLGGISVDVVRKDIKNVHLSVYPPNGRVRIAAPERMNLDTIRVFAISKLGWIKRQQAKLRGQEREAPCEYLERESHYVWGRRYLLRIGERDAAPSVELTARRIVLWVRPGTPEAGRRAVLEDWYRRQLRAAAMAFIAKWQPVLGVTVARLFVQRMKTKWGSCNHRAGTIRLNTELARKPPETLEYIVVHEMAHLVEPTHGVRFVEILDRVMPGWQHRRDQLNQLPVPHEGWNA